MEIMTTEGCDKFRNDSCVRNCCNTRAEKAYKVGIKEVVEWLEENCSHTYEHAYGQWAFTVKDFNAQLGEWGIK